MQERLQEKMTEVLTPCLLTTYLFTPCLLTPCLLTPCLLTPCLLTPCLLITCLLTPCLLTPCLLTPCLLTPCPLISCLLTVIPFTPWLLSLSLLFLSWRCHSTGIGYSDHIYMTSTHGQYYSECASYYYGKNCCLRAMIHIMPFHFSGTCNVLPPPRSANI